ncbi:hypothetical protein [Pengzhenrongella sp.]|jgi:hypothetical protein
MSTLDVLRLEQVWRNLPQKDRARIFDEFPDVYEAIEMWVRARG